MSGSRPMIGFTSRTFVPAVTGGRTTIADIVSWAAAERFPWMEVRDVTAALGAPDLRELARAAHAGGVRLHYAWDGTNLLDPADHELFLRGVQNASAFGPGTFARLTIAGHVIRDSAAKGGYSRAELDRLAERVEACVAAAQALGVQLVFENSYEPLAAAAAAGEAGITEVLRRIPSMMMTFDPGNFMDREHNRFFCGAADVKRFYAEHAARLPYVHVKMTRANIVQPVFVEDGDIEPDFYRSLLREGKLVCIELPEADDPAECRRRICSARLMLDPAAPA